MALYILVCRQKSGIIITSVKPAILFPSGGKNMSYDVAIIGAGVSGAMVARELSRYNIKVALVENAATWRWAQQRPTAPLSTQASTQCPAPSKRGSTLRALPQCPVCARHSMSRSSPSAHMLSLSRTRKLRLLKSSRQEAKRMGFPDSRFSTRGYSPRRAEPQRRGSRRALRSDRRNRLPLRADDSDS